jgi:hypothetical protein
VDGLSVEASTIKYSVDLQIRAVGATVVTGALVTRLKTTKLFLGFDWLRAMNPVIDWRTGRVQTEETEEPLAMQKTEEKETPLALGAIDENETPNYEEEFPTVFSEEEFRGLPPRRKWDHIIDLKDRHQPPRGKCYPLAAREKEALRKFIGDNVQDKRIRKSSSPYTSPFFFWIKQGTMELHGIQDYWRLNKITVKDRYPLPLI